MMFGKRFSILLAILLAALLSSQIAFALTITNLKTQDITDISATITWNTDKPATSMVVYGTALDTSERQKSNLSVTYHSITLTGLNPQTRYYYYVFSQATATDWKQDTNHDMLYTFTTTKTPDTVKPKISNITETLASASATISWKTDKDATSVLYYGIAPAIDLSETKTNLTKDHSITIQTQPRKTYKYIASSCDSAGNCVNSSAGGFSAGITNNFLTASVPEFTDTNRITITGTTKPFATVSVYINGELRLKKDADEAGFFEFKRATLYAESNNLTITAVDQLNKSISQGYVVIIDDAPPEASVGKLPDAVSQPKLTVKGNTSEPGKVLYSLKKELDKVPPERVVGLEAREKSSIVLSWTPNTEPDILEYAVYRDNVRIAVTKYTNYTDINVYKGKTYSYRVSAVDKSCNEGPLSDTFAITTKLGETAPTESYAATATVTPISFSCTPELKTLDVPAAGAFSFDVDLEQGANLLTVIVKDRAGNAVDFSQTIILDTIPPQILSTNLREIQTSYDPEVSITGKVSEEAGIKVWVNDKIEKIAKTDSEGNFKVGITLKRDPGFKLNATAKKVEAETGEGWENRIKLQAVDVAGLQSQPVEEKVTYALCGYGSWFNIDLRGPLPNTLNPRLMLEGIQQLGWSANISYRGGYKAVIRNIIVKPMTVSPAFEADYDHDWIQSIDKNFIRPKNEVGYISLNFKPLEGEIPGDTYYKKEDNLSSHRGGYFKALLLIEVDAQEEIPVARIDPQTQRVLENFTLRNIKQRQCVDVKVQIDKRIDPSIIHKGFLKKNIERLERLVKGIDRVLEPVQKAGTYAMTSCFVSNGLMWLTYFMEKTSCELATLEKGPLGLLETVLGGKKTIRTVAEAGLCDVAFPKVEGEDKEKNDKARDACNSCKSAIETTKNVEFIRDSTCDRVACPSVPTLQNYIKTQQKTTLAPITAGGKIYYKGSSCAFGGDATKGAKNPNVKVNELQVSADYEGVKKVYADYLVQKNKGIAKVGGITTPAVSGAATSPAGEGVGDNDVDCSGLHPADPRCCGYEYMQVWGSGCDLPLADDVLFDEIKESTCLGAQTTGASATEALREGKATAGAKTITEKIECSPNLFNAVAGFCEPNTGQPKGSFEPLRGVYYSKANSFPSSREKSGDKAAVYVGVLPVSNDEIGALRGIVGEEMPVQNYKIVRGQVVEKLKFEEQVSAPEVKLLLEGRAGKVKNIKPSAAEDDYDIPVQVGTSFVPDKDDAADVTNCFNPEAEEYKKLDDAERNAKQLECFENAICNAQVIASDKENTDACKANAKELFDKIKSKITTSDKAYIVDPAEGFFNSLRCVCIPAVQGQLQKWKSITILLKTCLESIYYTGDGSAGACQALISQYACDMLWDGISCFTQKYSLGAGKRVEESPGIGDVIGAFTGAGTDVYRSNAQRYGATPTWQSMFTERKLANAVCIWAFTGTWDLDMSTLYQDSVKDFPIDSTGVVLRGERRFVSFDPTTRPRGLATWNYRLGFMLAAGAELTYRLELKCSNSFDCDPRAGFKDGKCDCYGKTEQRLLVGNVYGRARKGEVLGSGPEGEQFVTVQAGDAGSNVRYDTAVLSWEWMDPKTNTVKKGEATKKIGLAGAEAPIFCSFDTFAFAYRCEFGIGEYAGAKFGDITPKFKEDEMFRKNDPLKFDAAITKQISTDTRETYKSTTWNKETKFLVYEVKNQNGVLVKSNNENPTALNSIESFTETVEVLPAIEQQHFTKTIAGEARRTDLWYWQDKWLPDTPHAYITKEDVLPDIGTYIVVVDGESYEVYLGTAAVQDSKVIAPRTDEEKKKGEWGYYLKGDRIAGEWNSSAQYKSSISNNVINYVKDSKTIFSVTLAPTRAAKNFEIIVRSKAEPAAVVGCDTTKPVTWTATFTMYDAINDYPYTINRNQVTQDASTGDSQTKTIQFSAICNDKIPATVTTAQPLLTRCSDDPTASNANPCYCGTLSDADANKLASTEKFNCGIPTGKGEYCINEIKEDKLVKVCSAKPQKLLTKGQIKIRQYKTTTEADISKLAQNVQYSLELPSAIEYNLRLFAPKLGHSGDKRYGSYGVVRPPTGDSSFFEIIFPVSGTDNLVILAETDEAFWFGKIEGITVRPYAEVSPPPAGPTLIT